ncbi:DUF309 domain-containing protein [Psychrobacillus vulpis]|uniref:DUF309 domain-containing protein n=1 Tax=Psychrobacillus vulpis TaxID=2325572 RepID=A0A544TUD7_9BACI|nr:DUF309 domain-containing protein [Psychrobacillus vulpis]
MHPTFHPNFVQFLKEFNETYDYFECHEVLEEYWKEVAPRRKVHPLTALILVSTGMYHWRRGNFIGAIKTTSTSIDRLIESSNSPFFETINYEKLLEDVTTSLKLMKNASTFQPFTIQITDKNLLTLVNNLKIDNCTDLHFLIHKHMLRDRSEILKEREKSKKRRDERL